MEKKKYFSFFGKTKKEEKRIEDVKMSTNGVPFLGAPSGKDLSKPFVNLGTYSGKRYEFFDNDNLYPNRLEQYYYLSPIHANCIDFTVSCIAGGGYELENRDTLSGVERLSVETFERMNNLKRVINQITLNYVLGEQFFVEVNLNDKIPTIKCLDNGGVRINYEKNVATICENWLLKQNRTYELPIYQNGMNLNTTKHFIYMFQNLKPGMKTYPLPAYNSVLNDIQNDASIAFFRLNALNNGVFPGALLSVPYEMTNDLIEAFQDMVSSQKGVTGFNKWYTVSGEGRENLPTLTPLNIAQNIDNLFTVSEESIKRRIQIAHRIPQALFGDATSGSLGNNQQILTELTTYSVLVANPRREDLNWEFNRMMNLVLPGYNFIIFGAKIEESIRLLIDNENKKEVEEEIKIEEGGVK